MNDIKEPHGSLSLLGHSQHPILTPPRDSVPQLNRLTGLVARTVDRSVVDMAVDWGSSHEGCPMPTN
jgi:hypothetical protein